MIGQVVSLAQSSVFDRLAEYLPVAAAATIVLLGLVIYGFDDLRRLSLGRIRAVASVSLRESLRRRVLWLTPLAIVAVILVAQFQRPLDEQDAIRQTTKFCLFASGVLVTIATVILACTNLPREIDNRVIFTIVTKPISRLELLLGKIAGFAAISALILIIMGAFTWGFLQVQQWRILRDIDLRLASGQLEPAARATLDHYKEHGLLDARNYVTTEDAQSYADMENVGEAVRVMLGDSEQEALFPFKVPQGLRHRIPNEGLGMVVSLKIPWQQQAISGDERLRIKSLLEFAKLPVPPELTDAEAGDGPAVDVSRKIPAFVSLGVYSKSMDLLVGDLPANEEGAPIALIDPTGQSSVEVPIPAELAARLAQLDSFYIRVTGLNPASRYTVSADSVVLLAPSGEGALEAWRSEPIDSMLHSQVIVRGRSGTDGPQIRGRQSGGAVGVFAYRNTKLPVLGEEAVFEFRTGIEVDVDDPAATLPATWGEFRVANRSTQAVSAPVRVPLETRRTAHFSVPSRFVEGGDFDVIVRAATVDHWIALRPGAMRLASHNRGFALNLAKSVLILWMFSVLVVTIAIFCSTFLSWPIAVVLTLLILLGNWGVSQLGDLMSPGVGRQVVGDLFSGAAPAVNETMVRSLEGLTTVLRGLANFLPDISQFAAMQDLEMGIWLDWPRLLSPLKVLGLFGLPILSLSYVFFRNKEVAP